MKTDIDDIFSQEQLSDEDFLKKLKTWLVIKIIFITFSVLLMIFIPILILVIDPESKLYIIFIVVFVLLYTQINRFISKKAGALYKSNIVKPFIQEKYSTSIYLQDDIPKERIQYANVGGNQLFVWNKVLGNDYFQAVTPDGRRFEFTDCKFLFQILAQSQVVYSGQIVMIQLPRLYQDTPVALLPKTFLKRSDKEFRNLPVFTQTALGDHFILVKTKKPLTIRRFFTDENQGFTLPKQTETDLNPLNDINDNHDSAISLNEFLNTHFVTKLIDLKEKASLKHQTINVSIQGDILSINTSSISYNNRFNINDLFEPHISDIFATKERMQERVKEEFMLLDNILEISGYLK